MGLKTFLALRSLTQEQFGQDVGLSKASTSRRANNQIEIKVRDLQRIWAAYGPLSDEEQQALIGSK